MKLSILSLVLTAFASTVSVEAFAPVATTRISSSSSSSSSLYAKYNTMDEILALFPEDIPVLINFYDANTEDQIKVSSKRSYLLYIYSLSEYNNFFHNNIISLIE